MTEVFIFNKQPWRDAPSKDRPDLTGQENVIRKLNENSKLSITQRTKNLIIEEQHHEAQDRPGDIVEIREYGAPGGSSEGNSWAKIIVDMDSAVAKRSYEGVHWDYTDPKFPVYKHKRGFWLDTTGLVLSYDKPIELSVADFISRLRAK